MSFWKYVRDAESNGDRLLFTEMSKETMHLPLYIGNWGIIEELCDLIDKNCDDDDRDTLEYYWQHTSAVMYMFPKSKVTVELSPAFRTRLLKYMHEYFDAKLTGPMQAFRSFCRKFSAWLQ